MPRHPRLQHRARWALLGFVLVLLAGLVGPLLAARPAAGPGWDSLCHSPATEADTRQARGPGEPLPARHEQIKCPLCWSLAIAPPPAPAGPPAVADWVQQPVPRQPAALRLPQTRLVLARGPPGA